MAIRDAGFPDQYYNSEPYIPASLSEIEDYLTGMLGEAPTFVSRSGHFPDQTIDTEFFAVTEGFSRVRKKLGEERYAKAIELAARAKALFADDPEESNGKTMQGIKLLHEIDDILHSVRKRRIAEKLPDEDGEVTGD